MKRWIAVAVLTVMLIAALAGAALAQGTNPPASNSTCPYFSTPGSTPRAGGMWGGDMRGGRGMPEWAGSDEAIEKLLDMTAEELQAERAAGKSLAEIAQGKGISEDALTAAIMDAKRTELAALVEAGTLTQTQADLMLERMEDQVKVMVERTVTGPMWRGQSQPVPSGEGQSLPAPMQGGRGGRGGMMGSRWNSSTR